MPDLVELAPPEASQQVPSSRALYARFQDAWASESARFVALVALLSYPAVNFLQHFYVNDPDLGWHLRSGQWILQHVAVPRTDPFSTYGADKPWIAYSWLFSVLLFKLYDWLGLSGVALFEIVFRTVLCSSLFYFSRRLGAGFWQGVALTLLAIYPMFRVLGPRPGMFTILFFIGEMAILSLAGRDLKPKLVWLLPALFALWANVHIQFSYGLFVLGLFAAEPAINRILRYRGGEVRAGQPKDLWLILAASFLATLLNPYGYRVYETVFQYIGQTRAFASIIELQSMDFRHAENFGAVFLALAAAYCLGWRQNLRPVQLFLLLFSSALAFRSVKDVWFLAVVALWVLSERSPGADLPIVPRSVLHRLAVPVCVTAVILFSVQRYGLTNSMLQMGYDGRFPEAAARYIESHHLPGPLFNDFNFGGFLIWRLPQYPVSMDGRTNVHGDDRVGRSFDTWRGKSAWQSDPDLAKANLVLAPKTYALSELLKTDPRFRLVFEDPQAAVFVRR